MRLRLMKRGFSKEIKEGTSLLEKLLTEHVVNKVVVWSTMAKIWKTSKPFSMLDISNNLFVISFDVKEDKEKVLKGRSWLFDNFSFNLWSFDEFPPSQMVFNKAAFWIKMYDRPLSCMNKDIRVQIGNIIGKVVECDVRKDEIGWGDVLRVLI